VAVVGVVLLPEVVAVLVDFDILLNLRHLQ
jgi:hypothetical protein